MRENLQWNEDGTSDVECFNTTSQLVRYAVNPHGVPLFKRASAHGPQSAPRRDLNCGTAILYRGRVRAQQKRIKMEKAEKDTGAPPQRFPAVARLLNNLNTTGKTLNRGEAQITYYNAVIIFSCLLMLFLLYMGHLSAGMTVNRIP